MFGYTSEEITGKELRILIPSRFWERHRKHVLNFSKTGTTNRKMGTLGTIYGLKSDNTEFPIEASISQVEHGNEKLFTVILRDITERLEAEEVKEKFRHLAENLNDVFYIYDPVTTSTIYVSPSFEKVWEQSTKDLYEGKIQWTDFIHPDDKPKLMEKSQLMRTTGTNLIEEFRIITPGNKIKWVSVKSSPLYDEEGKLTRITGTATEITERKNHEEKLKSIIKSEKEALAAAEMRKEKLEFIARASEILTSSLDYQQTLKSIAELATPALSDWCVIDLLDEAGNLERLTVSHILPEKVKLAKELSKIYGPSPEEKTGVYNVIRTGQSELYPLITDEMLREAARDEEHLRITLELGIKSGMIVPLKARGQIFGALTLIYAESNKYYNNDDLHFAEDLARRAALAIDNARLFLQAQELNAELDEKIKDLESEINNRRTIEVTLIENQEKLIQSEERLKAALNASETGTYRWYTDTNKMDVDEGYLRLFGLRNRKNLNYNDFLNYVHPEDVDLLVGEQEKCTQEDCDFEMEYRIIWPDRTIHWLLDKGKYVSESHYFTGACVDITFRKHAEQTLKDSEILFRQLAENIRDVFSIMNPKNMNVIYVSPVFEDIWGIKREEIYRNPDSFIKEIHPDDRERVMNLMKDGSTSGRYTVEFRIIRPDKTIKWLRSRGFPLYNEKNELYRIAGITEDITERKLAEEELHKNQEFLRSTVTSAPVILWAINNSCEITLLEGKGLNKIGLDADDNLGKDIFEVFKKTEEFSNYLNLAFKGNEISFTIHENSTWLEMRFSPLRDHDGNIQGVIGVAVDITQHKEAEEKILNSLKEKEVLLKEIHHRVKNNLQIISSILSLQSIYVNDNEINNIFEESKNRIKSMALLHEKLYQSKDFTKINFRNYVEDLVINLFRSYQIEPDRIRLQIKGNDIYIDAEKAISIGLIMNELVSNSLKYAFKDIDNGEIYIRYNEISVNTLKILLKDNGVGLPDNFNFLNTDTLGLQLIHSLVEQLDGTINVFNHNGASFEIILPQIIH
jgi:PAS domain S-box-containing protein